MAINTNSGTKDITFTQLPPSNKPRFNPFRVVPMELAQVAHKAQGLPMVIANGDVQIEPNHILAHGVEDGLDRVDEMVNSMAFHDDGGIAYFDPNEYAGAIKSMLKIHRDLIIDSYHVRAQFLLNCLYKAEQHYILAIQAVNGKPEEIIFRNTLKEIQARINFDKAQKLRKSLYDATGTIPFDKVNVDTVAAQLIALNNHLFAVWNDLPISFMNERQTSINLLKETSSSFKDLGNQYFKKQAWMKAAEMYERALNIYQIIYANRQNVEELTLYSNLIIAFKKDGQIDKAIILALHAIEEYPDSKALIPIKTKVMFNLITAFNALNFIRYKRPDEPMLVLIQKVIQCVMEHTALLTERQTSGFRELIYSTYGVNCQPQVNRSVSVAGLGFFSMLSVAQATGAVSNIFLTN